MERKIYVYEYDRTMHGYYYGVPELVYSPVTEEEWAELQELDKAERRREELLKSIKEREVEDWT